MADTQMPGESGTQGNPEAALKQLQERYVLVGGHRVRSWHAWLTIGVVIGIASGVILVANRTGEFEESGAVGEPEAPVVLSFTPSVGPTGTTVRVAGKNFTPTGNEVSLVSAQLGTITVGTNLSSSGGGITFTVPSTVALGTYGVFVRNANGTSQPPSFTVVAPSTGAPTITSLSSTSSPVGTVVTITGTNFLPTGNTVAFKNILGLDHLSGRTFASSDGTTIAFTVPAVSSGGEFKVSVTSGSQTSNVVLFRISSSVINSITPSSATFGTTVIISGIAFTPTRNEVFFDTASVGLVSSSEGGTKLTVKVPLVIRPSALSVTVKNAYGTSNAFPFTILSAPTTPAGITISSLSPSSGAAGARVTISGRNFAPTGNKIAFVKAFSAVDHLRDQTFSSSDGTTLIFTVPNVDHLGPYQIAASAPGTASSNMLWFTVTR